MSTQMSKKRHIVSAMMSSLNRLNITSAHMSTNSGKQIKPQHYIKYAQIYSHRMKNKTHDTAPRLLR